MSSATASSATQSVAKNIRRASPQRVASFLAGLKELAATTPHRLLPGTERVRFLVRNRHEKYVTTRRGSTGQRWLLMFGFMLTFSKPHPYFPNRPEAHESRFSTKIGEPSHLPLLSYYNPSALIEFEYRKKDVDPKTPKSDAATEQAASSASAPYFTREFLDVWQTGSNTQSRYDITDFKAEAILSLVCEPVEGPAQALPLPKATGAIPLEEGPELDAYIAQMNAARLAELRSSGELAKMEAKREQQKVESAQRKAEREEKAARAAAQADDVPPEGLELFTLDDELASTTASSATASSAEAGVESAATADDFEHSSSAWDAIEKKMKARANGAAPPSS